MKCPVCDKEWPTVEVVDYGTGPAFDCLCGQRFLSPERGEFMQAIGDILRAREAHQAKQKEPNHDPH